MIDVQELSEIATLLVDLLIEDCNSNIRQDILSDIRECHKLMANPTLEVSESLALFIKHQRLIAT
jgi:hypothetical protein